MAEVTSAMPSPHPNMRRRKTEQSPFKVPDSNSIFLQSLNEREDRKEEMRKFMALSIEEKTTHTTRMTAKLRKEEEEEEEKEEEREKKKIQIKSTKKTVSKQTPSRNELRMAMLKRENFTKDSKHGLICMERQKAVLELSLMTKRSEILRMDKAIAKEERQLRQLEEVIERDNLNFEGFLRENEKKSVEARTLFELEAKSKQEKNAEIKKLTAEIGVLRSELENLEEILTDYKRYKKLLFQLSPPEWKEAQKTKKAKKAKVLSDDRTGSLRSQLLGMASLESKESSPGQEPPSITGTKLSSAHSGAPVTYPSGSCEVNSDSSEYEDEPELYFTNPQQLLDLVSELTEQNLSLIQNSTRVEETLEELRQSMEATRKKIEKDEEQLILQIKDMNQRIDTEKARGAKLRQKVQLHVSLNTEDQDVMLDALSEKVVEVHRCCVEDRITNLSTLEKLASIEKRMSLLLLGLESIPEESLETMKKIKDSERRSRQREEKQKEQVEKQQERMRRYLERSLADSKKTSGRKLMPRCIPVARKAKVSHVDNTAAEDELHAYLFTSEDME